MNRFAFNRAADTLVLLAVCFVAGKLVAIAALVAWVALR